VAISREWVSPSHAIRTGGQVSIWVWVVPVLFVLLLLGGFVYSRR
jgi:hypothetical protein